MKEPPGRSARETAPGGTTWSGTAGADLTWGVGAVAARLGVAASTLRTWERRYGVGPSHRTQGGHRRYTERDIDRVELVRRLVTRGVSAQDAARVARHLDRDELRIALDEPAGAPVSSEDLVDALLAAATTNDLDRFGALVDRLLGDDEVTGTWTRVLSPVLVRMAAERATDALDAEAEHAATEHVVRGLREIRDRSTAAGHQVLLASAVGDAACLPMLALGAGLVQSDVAVRATGPETDARALVDLTRKLEPRVVVLWGHPPGLDAGMLRHLDERADQSFLVRAAPCWPHEMGLRFGSDEHMVPMDVAVAVRHVLDRVP